MWKADLSVDHRLVGLLLGLHMTDPSGPKQSSTGVNIHVAMCITLDGLRMSTCHQNISSCAHLFLPRSSFHSFECSLIEPQTVCVSLTVLLDLMAETSRTGLVFHFDWSREQDYLAVEWRGLDGAKLNCKLCLFEHFSLLEMHNLSDQSADGLRIILTAEQWKAVFVGGDLRISDRVTIQSTDSMVKLIYTAPNGTELYCTHSKEKPLESPWQSLTSAGLFEATYRTICFSIISLAAAISDKIIMRCRQVDGLCEVDILCPLSSAEPALLHYIFPALQDGI